MWNLLGINYITTIYTYIYIYIYVVEKSNIYAIYACSNGFKSSLLIQNDITFPIKTIGGGNSSIFLMSIPTWKTMGRVPFV